MNDLVRYVERVRAQVRPPAPVTLNGPTLDELAAGRWNTGRPLHQAYTSLATEEGE